MSHIPKPTVNRILYWSLVTTVMLIALAASSVVRRSHEIDTHILRACRTYGMHPGIVSAVIWKESRFDPAARGKAGEIGLMQVTDGAGMDWAHAHDVDRYARDTLWDPKTNITVGTWYLSRAIQYWEQRECRDPLPFALAEYNAGRDNVTAWVKQSGTDADAFVEHIAFPGTRQYIDDVLTRYRGARRDR